MIERLCRGIRFVIFGLAIALSMVQARPAPASPREVTFNKDVLPILQKNCQTCHRPGEIGPMPLLTYEATRPWARAIRESVLARRMPPWFSDAPTGQFVNDRRLAAADIETIAAWVDAGAPEGEPGSKPPPVQWTEGWRIKPDVIYEMPQPYPIPAKGVVDYVYVLLPAKFPEDTWVLDGEIRPGNRGVVHHSTVVIRPPGSRWLQAAKTGVPYVPTAEDPSAQTEGFSPLVSYAPGAYPDVNFLPGEDAGRLIPAGSDLFLEMHYTVNGSATEDRTRAGLVLSTKRPAKQLLNLTIQNSKFEIPPYAANYSYDTGVILNEPITLVYAAPHMHMRGAAMKIEATYPSGRSEVLLNVPRYNFMWQAIYKFATPRELPKGTLIIVSAQWDNSANNKYNPDPSMTVRYGLQSSEEMMVAILGGVVDAATDRYHASTLPPGK